MQVSPKPISARSSIFYLITWRKFCNSYSSHDCFHEKVTLIYPVFCCKLYLQQRHLGKHHPTSLSSFCTKLTLNLNLQSWVRTLFLAKGMESLFQNLGPMGVLGTFRNPTLKMWLWPIRGWLAGARLSPERDLNAERSSS